MFPFRLLLITLLFAISTTASPVEGTSPRFSLPIVKRIHFGGNAANVIRHDQARAATFTGRDSASMLTRQSVGSIEVVDRVVGYIASVGVGNPATPYDLVIDTGSSNTWIGYETPYTPTSTSEDTGEPVRVCYHSSPPYGEEWLDTVTLSSELVISQQSIGVADNTTGLTLPADGILGLGVLDQTLGTLIYEPDTPIPTVTQNLYKQGTIPVEVVSVSFAPTDSLFTANGELTFGGTDPTMHTGSISYTPITSTSPASEFWGINSSIAYGDDTILSDAAGVVDTGTTLILIANDAYTAYMSATGAVEDPITGHLKLTAVQYDNLQNLNFNIGSETYTLIPNAQIWPRALNAFLGGSTGAIYLIVGNIGTSQLDFIMGLTFLERFYSVFDTTNQQIGFATTSFTDAIIN